MVESVRDGRARLDARPYNGTLGAVTVAHARAGIRSTSFVADVRRHHHGLYVGQTSVIPIAFRQHKAVTGRAVSDVLACACSLSFRTLTYCMGHRLERGGRRIPDCGPGSKWALSMYPVITVTVSNSPNPSLSSIASIS